MRSLLLSRERIFYINVPSQKQVGHLKTHQKLDTDKRLVAIRRVHVL
jgi:hypothetical protein